MITHDGKVYLTPQEASTRFVIHLATVYHWCRAGVIKVVSPQELGIGVSSSKYLIEEESLKAQRERSYEGV